MHTLLVLAGGAGTRYGGTKQLARYAGMPLIRHVTMQCLGSRADKVIVCAGAYVLDVRKAIVDLDVTLVSASDWSSGMSATLRAGVTYLQELKRSSATVLITLGDLPLMTSHHYNTLYEASVAHPDHIVAASYNGVHGVPALFPARYFPELLSVQGDRGARDIIRASNVVFPVPMADAARDVDRPEDLPD